MIRLRFSTDLTIPLSLIVMAAGIAMAPGTRAEGASQDHLQQAINRLNAMAPRMDTRTRSHLDDLRAMLVRVFNDRDQATDSEVEFANLIVNGGGSRGLDDPLQGLESAVGKMPGIASIPRFQPGSRRTPGGHQIGYVDLLVSGRKRTVVEIPTPTPGWPVSRRAREIARKMQLVAWGDPLWWTRLKPAALRQDYVVESPRAPGGYLITADPSFAREWGLTPYALASQLVKDVRLTLDPPRGSRALPTPAETAISSRQQGDEAFARQDWTGAEQQYLAAIQASPSYVVAYERLAGLYTERNQPERARHTLSQALGIPGLDAADRVELRSLLNSIAK